MNVLYVDINGVLNSASYNEAIVDRMVKTLSEICHLFDCKVCIESTHKPVSNEWEEESELITELEKAFKKYNIDLIGYTPSVQIQEGCATVQCWKDFEIIYHLMHHPEIKHFAVIDDNDFIDLTLLKEYLVETIFCNRDNPELEGLLPEHKAKIEKVLKLDNKYNNILKN